MKNSLELYLIELESKIQVLERENEVLSSKAEENLLLNSAFEKINVFDDIDNLLLNTLESISVLLNIQFTGLFIFKDNYFKCISSYALFSNEDNLDIDFSISEINLRKIFLKQTCLLQKNDKDFFFKYSTIDFNAHEALIIALNSVIIKDRYFVFITDENGIQLADRLLFFEKVIRIISAKLERIYYQNELEKLNVELEQKVELRTLELNNQNKEYQALTEEYKTINEELLIAKENAEESESQFKNLFENAADAIFIADQESGQILSANLAAEKLLQLPYDRIIELNQANLHPQNLEIYSKETFHQHQEEAKKSNVTNFIETKIIRADGTEVPVEILASEVFYKGKKCLMGTFRDVTERKKAELDLIEAKEHAEESDRLKTAFLQNMSHEIRTPMNAIMGFSSLLYNNFDDKDKLANFSAIINQRCSDLLEIINDVLDISKIESGQSTINIEKCNINELFSELSSFFIDYQNRTNKQHIELLLQPLHNESDAIVKTEKVKLKQILVNLISNAFKFTETGHIRCGCEIENNKIKFYVSDTGVGIPKHKFDFIFERFTQLNNSSSQNSGGTGLGLPIVRGLVGLMGGQVWLESECNKGSTFFFTIDYIPCKEAQNLASNGVKNNDRIFITKTILIVEDDLYNAMYLNEILKRFVENIFIVNNGADAIEFVKKNTVDGILMDVRLPDISGYEATKEILKHNPDIIIIAQTAYAAQDERQKALNNGCIDYISKPTEQEKLLTILRKYLK